MSRVIIHIGMPKTGSSSIQESLAHLNNPDFSYLSLATNHSGIMRHLFMKSEGSARISRRRNKLIRDELENNKKENLIISGEGIWHLPRYSLRKMKRFLSHYFDDIAVIGYVRPPASYISSAFQQLVKRNALTEFDIEKCYPQYQKKFEKFDLIFGESNVRLKKFDSSLFPEKNVVLDFCKEICMESKPPDVVRVNESLSREATAFLYVMNQSFFIPLSVRNILVGELLKNKGGKFLFSQELVDPVLYKNKEDIKWMESRLGSSLLEEESDFSESIKSERDLFEISAEVTGQLVGATIDQLSHTDIRSEHIVNFIGYLDMFLNAKK